MYKNILLPQLKRVLWRVVLFLMLLAIATAFFCSSANLYVNSESNISKAGDAFSTIAILEFMGVHDAYYDAAEQLGLTPKRYSDCPMDVTDVDFQQLAALPGVDSIDLRRVFCAYIPEANAVRVQDSQVETTFGYDLIRFTIETEKPIIIDAKTGLTPWNPVSITILDSASGIFSYGHAYTLQSNLIYLYTNAGSAENIYSESYTRQQEDLESFTDQTKMPAPGMVILDPDTEYLASVFLGDSFPGKAADGKVVVDSSNVLGISSRSFIFSFDRYGGEPVFYRTFKNDIYYGFYEKASNEQPIGIWKWDDVCNDVTLSRYFDRVYDAYQYSAHSFVVMTTDDVAGLPAFHQQEVVISEGRDFSAQEHEQGARVCLVNDGVASEQGWKIGDTIDMHFYEYDGFVEFERASGYQPLYTQRNEGFFDGDKYTIVGFWSDVSQIAASLISDAVKYLPYNTIIVPTSSVQNLDSVEAPASGSRLTVHLKNGMMEEFLEAASKVTLSESADEVRITAFDQGYSQAQDSLQSMLGTAQFLLVLSSVLLVVAGVLLAFFYVQSQKQNMALMRLLGCNRRQAGTMAILGSLMILIPGGLLGMGAGHLLTDRVAGAILSGTNTLDKPEYAAFREVFGVQAEVDFALSAQPAVSAVALALAAGLFLAGCLLFILLQLKKEPREALQDK